MRRANGAQHPKPRDGCFVKNDESGYFGKDKKETNCQVAIESWVAAIIFGTMTLEYHHIEKPQEDAWAIGKHHGPERGIIQKYC